MSEGCSSNESLSVVDIVDGPATSKVDVRTAIPVVGDPAIDVVFRRLDDENPERVVK